jgi:hypothetical protein
MDYETNIPTVRNNSLIAAVLRQGYSEDRDEGGCYVVLPARAVSSYELKQALDTRFAGQYSVQV